MVAACQSCNQTDLGFVAGPTACACQYDPIYCNPATGIPGVIARKFQCFGRARVDHPSQALPANGTALANGAVVPVSVTNNSCEPMCVIFDLRTLITVDVATSQRVRYELQILVDGAVVGLSTVQQPVFGGLSGNSSQAMEGGFSIPHTIAPCTTVQVTPRVVQQFVNGGPLAGTTVLASTSINIFGGL